MIDEELLQRIRRAVAEQGNSGRAKQVELPGVDDATILTHVKYLVRTGELKAIDVSHNKADGYLVQELLPTGWDAMRVHEEEQQKRRPLAKAGRAFSFLGVKMLDAGIGFVVGVAVAYASFSAGLCPP